MFIFYYSRIQSIEFKTFFPGYLPPTNFSLNEYFQSIKLMNTMYNFNEKYYTLI